ncbi:MAG: SDR family oxidoreductase [Alphaproteobacteria bacterium]|nr:SDR family oxidoreductase [Alphaproteobacteria bacterium]
MARRGKAHDSLGCASHATGLKTTKIAGRISGRTQKSAGSGMNGENGMKEFAGKVVWMTGAGTGIGKAGALMFARGGASVALLGRRRDKLDEVAAEIAALGGTSAVEPLDVADRGKTRTVAAALLKRFGRVDILVNNAGLNIVNRRLDEITAEDWDQVLAANLTGAFNMVQAAMPAMRAQKDGLIINVASTAARRVSGVAGIAYSASKFGMLGMSLSLTQEAWKSGIRACCLCPDDVNTPIMARRKFKYPPDVLAQFIQPEDLADTMRFVALLPKNTSIPEMVITPTNVRPYTPAETG